LGKTCRLHAVLCLPLADRTPGLLARQAVGAADIIVTPNFYVIKEYNNSDLYALYIGNLADRIAYNGGAFQGGWGDVGK
ncbi:lytic murein transglycosylase, partial [Rhizobium ruizarguesonis]